MCGLGACGGLRLAQPVGGFRRDFFLQAGAQFRTGLVGSQVGGGFQPLLGGGHGRGQFLLLGG